MRGWEGRIEKAVREGEKGEMLSLDDEPVRTLRGYAD